MSKYRIISKLDRLGVEEYYIEEKVRCFFRDKWVSVSLGNFDIWDKFSTLNSAKVHLKIYIEYKEKIKNFKPEIHEYNPGDL